MPKPLRKRRGDSKIRSPGFCAAASLRSTAFTIPVACGCSAARHISTLSCNTALRRNPSICNSWNAPMRSANATGSASLCSAAPAACPRARPARSASAARPLPERLPGAVLRRQRVHTAPNAATRRCACCRRPPRQNLKGRARAGATFALASAAEAVGPPTQDAPATLRAFAGPPGVRFKARASLRCASGSRAETQPRSFVVCLPSALRRTPPRRPCSPPPSPGRVLARRQARSRFRQRMHPMHNQLLPRSNICAPGHG